MSNEYDFPPGALFVWPDDTLPPGYKIKADPSIVRAVAVYDRAMSVEEMAAWTARGLPEKDEP